MSAKNRHDIRAECTLGETATSAPPGDDAGNQPRPATMQAAERPEEEAGYQP